MPPERRIRCAPRDMAGMEVLVIALLVVPPILVGVVGWAAARVGARSERRAELGLGRRRVGQRAAYTRMRSEPGAEPEPEHRAA